MFCKSCGKELSDDALMCPSCGSPTDNHKNSKPVGTVVLVLGYIMSFLIPILGIIVGIYVWAKGSAGHGIAMIGLALFLIFLFMGMSGV